jgi:hypothetical protein
MSDPPDLFGDHERAARRAGRIFVVAAVLALVALALIIVRSAFGASCR